MNELNFRTLDLNLLRVFDEVMAERNLTRAAHNLAMTQPAVSNALRRLRQLLGDELFVRTPTGMRPTPYAEQLAAPVAQALEALHAALNVRASFDPSTSTRRFTLALTDVGEIYFLPVLMDALAAQAPGVKLHCVPVGAGSLRDDMAAGRVDLALGLLPQLQAGFYQQALFRQHYIALMRQAHPLAGKNKLTLTAFTQAEHVRILASGTGHGRVDVALEQKGLRRRFRLTVPHYVALGDVLSHSDLLATVPERFADRTLVPFDLVKRELPIDVDVSAIHQFWHSRLHRDPGHQWLRQFTRTLFGDGKLPHEESPI